MFKTINSKGITMKTLLQDMLDLQKFAQDMDACISEAELWDRYGKINTINAIDQGLLEHRRIKFRDGYGRCVCWLSDKGREVALAEDNIASLCVN